MFLHHILFSKINKDHLAISHDNKLFISVDVLDNGKCLFRALVESDNIPISDSKTFRSDLSIRTKILLKNGSLHSRQIRNYFNNNENSSKGGSIEDYIDCVMSVNGKWGPIFEMICVSIIYCVRIISVANISGILLILKLLKIYQQSLIVKFITVIVVIVNIP